MADDNEPSVVTTEVMLARLRDFTTTGVSQTAGLMIGGVFATAAVTFLEILKAPDHLPERLSGWLLGVIGTISFLSGSMRRALVDTRPNVSAVPIITVAGLLSMLGFALLGPVTGGDDGWRYSYLALGLTSLLIARSYDEPADHVEPELRPLFEALQVRRNRRGHLIWLWVSLPVIPFVLAMADRYLGWPLTWPILAVNLALCAAEVASTRLSQRYYASLYEQVYALHAAKVKSKTRTKARTRTLKDRL